MSEEQDAQTLLEEQPKDLGTWYEKENERVPGFITSRIPTRYLSSPRPNYRDTEIKGHEEALMLIYQALRAYDRLREENERLKQQLKELSDPVVDPRNSAEPHG